MRAKVAVGLIAVAVVVGGHAATGTGPGAVAAERAFQTCVSGPENGFGSAHPGRDRALVKSDFGCGRQLRLAFKRITRAVHRGRCDQDARFCQNTRRWSCFSDLGESHGGYVRCRHRDGRRLLYWVSARDVRAGFNWGAP